MRCKPTGASIARRRHLLIENLERRDLLANDLPFQNPIQRFDVNRDLKISALDALGVINFLARIGDSNTLPASNDEGRFPDVNGSRTATALDALQVINRLAVIAPTFAGRLVSDSAAGGTTNNDLVTNNYSLEFGVTRPELGDQIEARINGTDTDPFVNINSLFDPGTMRLSETAIDQVAGSPLADGDNRFEIRIAGSPRASQFVLTVDRVAPDLSVAVAPTVRETFRTLSVRSDEPLGTDVTADDLFQLTVSGGANHGTVIPVASVGTEPLTNTTLVNFGEALADQSYRFEVSRPIGDVAGNETTIPATLFDVADPTGIGEVSPAAGERLVSVNRETVIRFDEQVDPDSITGGGKTLLVTAAPANSSGAPPIHVIANGQRLGGRLIVSSTERFATFYFDDPLPASTEVRIVVDGQRIMGRDGLLLDADGNNEPGGVRTADFRTLPIGAVAGTGIFGFVKDSTTGEPIVGATIRVDNLPEKNAVTDASGRFDLVDLPAPEVFVHVDGTTATNLPAGFIYPNVGKPFHSTAGQAVQLNMAGEPFDIFLPRLKETDIQELSPTTVTQVGIGAEGKQRLAEIFPGKDPSLFDLFELRIAPGAAVDDFGNPATRAAIIPVEPDRIPAPLPSFLDPSLVVSIQVPGATSFDVPAEITFPNLDGLAPGEKSQIFSFDHDRGAWKLVGTGTVSEDGRSIVSDGGVIQAPGWHNTQGGALVKSKIGGGSSQQNASVAIFGNDKIFAGMDRAENIRVQNTSDIAVTLEISAPNMIQVTKSSLNRTVVTLPAGKSYDIPLVARDVTTEDILALQDDDPNTRDAKIITGKVNVVAKDGQGTMLADKTFLYGVLFAEGDSLQFPVALEEEAPEQGVTPPPPQNQVIEVEVVGPVNMVRFTGSDKIIAETSDQGRSKRTTLTVSAIDLAESPTGDLTLSDGTDELDDQVSVNPAPALQLNPFAIRRVSGTITGTVEKEDISINGGVEIGLAGQEFEPFLKIDGSFIVTKDEFKLTGKITTNLLQSIPGFSRDIVLFDNVVLTIDRATREFKFGSNKHDDKQEPAEKDFKLAGMKFSITDMFLPATGIGLGLRGSVTLPDKLGNLEIQVDNKDGRNNSVLITTEGVDVTGAKIEFADVDKEFKLFNVSAKATGLSLEFQRRGVDEFGVTRGNRFLVRGDVELQFPEFDPDLRVAASFKKSEATESNLIDLDKVLGPAWAFALREQPELGGLDNQADASPPLVQAPDDSFIRLEQKPDGTLGLDAVGRLLVENLKIKAVEIDAFLSIDTVEENYLGFARIKTPIKRAGEFVGLVGFRGGNFDLVVLGAGDLNHGAGFPIGAGTLYLQALGGGIKDFTQGFASIDLIAAATATLGPGTPKLFPGFSLPSYLGGLSYPTGDLLRIDVGANIGLTELNLGGQIVIGAKETNHVVDGVVVGVGEVNFAFTDPALVVKARLEALDGLVTLEGLNGESFASLTINKVNDQFNLSADGTAFATLPDTLPFGFGWAAGKELARASGAIKIVDDSNSENDYIAFWGQVPIFINPINGNVTTATAGLQVFMAARLPTIINSASEAQMIAGGGEGEFSGQATFEIPADEPYTIFAAEWENASTTARIELVDPSGTTIPEDQFDANPMIQLLASSDNSRDVVVAEPAGGQWTVRVVDDVADDLGNVQFVSLLDAPLPTIDVTAVAVDAAQLTVDFHTTDASENAVASVYLDSDRNDFDGMLLANDLPIAADGTGKLVIDIAGLELPPGSYFAYAQVDDPGKPLALSEYFADGFSIVDPTALSAVENVQAVWLGGTQLEVSWDALSGAEAYVVRLTDNASGVEFQQTLDSDSAATSIVISDGTLEVPLVSGETYRIAVIALDSDGVPGSGGGQTVATVGISQSILPEDGQFAVYAIPGETYTGQVALEAGDRAELIAGPAGSGVDAGSGLFSWDVPVDASGFTDVSIKITPAEGRSRYDEFTLLASAIPMGTISAQAFDDANRDGLKAVQEIGTNGVTVELLDAISGTVLRSGASADVDFDQDSSIDPATEGGIVRFENLNPGRYVVRRTDILGQDQPATVRDAMSTFVVLGDRSDASISGTVWLDQDFDGAGDVPLAGIVVGLDVDGNGMIDFESTTFEDDPATEAVDETGTYHFDELLAGDYDVMVVLPVDLAAVGAPTQSVTLDADEQLPAVDFTLAFDPFGDAPSPALFETDPSRFVFSQIDFGEILADGPGGELVTVNLELRNLGGGNLVLDTVEVADAGAGFAVSGIGAGTTILPDGFLDSSSAIPLTLTFDPLVSGALATTLSIASNDPDGPLVVDLFGHAIANGPELAIDTPNNNAGGVAVGGTQTRADFLRLTNIGSQDLTISEISGSLGFAASGLPVGFPVQPIVLAPSESINLDLDVAPSQFGLQSGTMQIRSDDVNHPVQTQFIVATGIGGNGPEATVGGDFVAVATPAIPGSPVLRDITGPSGEYEFILAAMAGYEVVMFDPDSGLVAKSTGITGESGATSDVNTPAFLGSTAPDSDNDTLPDDIEFAIGTSITNPDTDNDGINDFAEISQGLNPLSGLLVGTGIIASLPLMGEAKDVVLAGSQDGGQLAFVPTGEHGLAIVDVTDALNPIVLGQLDLPGDATDVDVDVDFGLAAVASGSSLHFVDVSDPMIPTLVRSISAGATRLEVLGGVAYIIGGNVLVSVDMVTGEILQSVTGGSFTDIARVGEFLFTMETENNLRVYQLEGLNIIERGSLALTNGGGQLFVGGGIAYVPALDREQGGFSTVDVSDPLNPTLISDSDVTMGVAPRVDVVPNGSGLGIALGSLAVFASSDVIPVIDVVDLSDPSNTNIFDDTFRTRFSPPESPLSGAIGAGIAFVADAASGLQVVNFLPFDDQQTPPTVSISLPDLDVDAVAAGIQVLEGTTLPVVADVFDDVQVRNVELLVNGRVISSDISFPFDLTTFAPALTNGTSTLTLQARASDTGGNMALSNLIMLEVIEDTVPPTIDAINITDGSTVDAGVVPIVVDFSEAIDLDTINSTNFALSGTLLGPLEPLGILISPDRTSVRLTYLLVDGDMFQFTIDAASVTDRAQNPLGADPVVIHFTIDAPRTDANPIFPEILVNNIVPADVTVGDFNRDGVPDLATANLNSPLGFSVSLGNGNGTFADPVDFEAGTNPRSVVSGDFDDDGSLDLLVAGGTADLSLLLGLGDGSFAPPAAVPVGAGFVSDLTIVDIDGNGTDDALSLTTTFGLTELIVLLGNGDGTFGEAQRFSLGGIGPAGDLTIGEFDDNDVLDVAASGTSVGVILGNGDGTFGSPQSFVGIGGDIFAADVNSDHELDLINGSFGNNITISLGVGDGTFAAPTTVEVPGGRLVVEDFDGDDAPDIAALHEKSDDFSTEVSVVLGNGDGTFGVETKFDVAAFPTRLKAADINLDGNVDLLTARDSVDTGPLSILFGVGDGTFRAQKRFLAGAETPDEFTGPAAVVLGDANGDQIPDVITANSRSDDISLLIGNGDGTFADQVNFPAGDAPDAVVAGDFNGDNKLDVVTANQLSSDVTILLGDGLGGFALPASFAVGGVPNTLSANDLNNDDVPDLVVGLNSNTIAVLLSVGDGTFATATAFDAGSTPTSSAFASIVDMNNDDVPDIVSANRRLGSAPITLLNGNGDGTFAAAVTIAEIDGLFAVSAADVNADDRVDLVALSNVGGTNRIDILLGQSDGSFTSAGTVELNQFTEFIMINDVNGDDHPDILTTNRVGRLVSALLGDGTGAFARELQFGAGQGPQSLAVGDVNDDGAVDIITGNVESGDISVLLNQRPPMIGGESESRGDALLVVSLNRVDEGGEEELPALDAQLIDTLLSENTSWLD